jgi:hypothetical protein
MHNKELEAIRKILLGLSGQLRRIAEILVIEDARQEALAPTRQPKIVEYRIVGRKTADELQAAVIGHIAEGWQPFGGVALQHSLNGTAPNFEFNTYPVQAMVKYSKPKRKATDGMV